MVPVSAITVRYNLEDGGRVAVKGGISDGKIVLELSNPGSNIPEKDLALIIEQFQRVEKSRATHLGGSGIGLAIAKKIVPLHGGTIQIGNTPDRLVKITVCSPLTT